MRRQHRNTPQGSEKVARFKAMSRGELVEWADSVEWDDQAVRLLARNMRLIAARQRCPGWWRDVDLSHLPPVLTPYEVADLLRVSSSTVYGWLERGDLPACKAGVLWRIDRDDLAEFLGQ